MRFLSLGALMLVAALIVAGCGSSDSSTSTQAAAGQGRGGFQLTADQQACLKKQGVTLPTGARRGGQGGFRRPTGQGGPTGQRPTGGRGPTGRRGPTGAGGANFQKMQKAFAACGVQFGGGDGAPPAPGTDSGSDS